MPPQEKKELAQEEKWKLVMLLGLLFLAFLICLSLILFSVNFYISGGVASHKILLEQREKEFMTSHNQTLRKNIISLNQSLSWLDVFYQNQFKVTDVLKKISESLPADIYLTNLSCSETGCSLSGFSPTRESLLNLKDNLEKEKSFEEILFPPASWVKASDINFSASFKIKEL